MPPLSGNPYLDAYRRWTASGKPPEAPGELLWRFGFVVPDAAALLLIEAHSPAGVMELGAGTGYWARLLHDRGVDVIAYDVAPPPSTDNQWFAGSQPWFPVETGDERVVVNHPDRTLLIVWPTRNESWAADAAVFHLKGGGHRLVYVGEPPGGRTGDLRLHAVLDLIGPCLACEHGVSNAPCVCDVTVRWRPLKQVPLPCWQDREDRLFVFGASDEESKRGWCNRWRQRRRTP